MVEPALLHGSPGRNVMNLQKPMLIAVAAALAAVTTAPLASAADASRERTTMPDFCSNRDVTCVLPDGAPPRAAPGTGKNAIVVTPPATPATAPGLVGGTTATPTVPASPGQAPSLGNTGPSLGNTVPALPSQVPGTTSGTATGTTSSTTGGTSGGGSFDGGRR